MDDKDPRLERDRLKGRRDEEIAGREHVREPRLNDYTASSIEPPSSSGTAAGADRDTRELRRDIQRTRADMSETVSAIEDRLNPRSVASRAAETVRETARERARDVTESEPVQYARANPIPIAMIGVGVAGLAWLAFAWRQSGEWRYERSRGRAYNAYGVPVETAGEDWTGDTSEDWSGEVRDRASALTSRARNAASRAGDVTTGVSRRARQETSRARTQLQRTWNENPLLVGAAAALAGAIIGAALPETRREHELMGETRDDLIEGVQQTVRDKVHEVQETATKAVDQVQRVAGLGSTETSEDRPAQPRRPDRGRA